MMQNDVGESEATLSQMQSDEDGTSDREQQCSEEGILNQIHHICEKMMDAGSSDDITTLRMICEEMEKGDPQ